VIDKQALRILEGKIVWKIYGPVKEGESWRIGTNKEIKDILQGTDVVKFVKSLRLRWCGHGERMRIQRMPKQIVIATMEGTRKTGRPCNRWRDEVEQDLNIMGIKCGQAIFRDCRNGG
jgi:hypothetical protein